MPIDCFWLQPTTAVRVSLRRYTPSDESECPIHGYHTERVDVDEIDEELARIRDTEDYYEGDTRWPVQCSCGYMFGDDDKRQVFTEHIYKRWGNGETMTLGEAPPGAMWNAYWRDRVGPDGLAVMVKLPGGQEWFVDGRATNCTKPDDDEHYCWPRTGEVPEVTVDKDVGDTCGAGAGSIKTDDFHGFLRDGKLIEA